MKISIDKSTLISALDIVLKATPLGKVSLQILEGVLLDTHDSQLHFSRNNLDIAIKYTVDCEVLEPGEIVVNARLFTDIIKKMSDEEIDISTTDNKMTIEAGQTRMEIAIVPSDGFPAMPEVKMKASFEIEQQLLKEMINGVAFAISEDANKPTLSGIYINIQDGALDVVGIDGYMMAWRKAKTEIANLRMLPKGNDLVIMSHLLDKGKVRVTSSDNLVAFVMENMMVTLRSVNGEYLNYKSILPSNYETTARIKVSDFRQTLERSLIFREARDGKIKGAMIINVTQKGLKMTMTGSNGAFDENFPADVDGKDIRIGFDSLKLSECLKHIEDKEVLMKFTTEIGPCLMFPVEGDSYAYMVLPVRI